MGCIQGSGPGSRAQNPYFGPYLAQKGPIYLDRKVDMGSGPCTGASWARGWGPQKGPYFGPYLGHILTPFWSTPGQKGLKSLYRKVDMGSGALREWLRTPLRMAQKGVQNDLFLGHILTPFWSPPGQYRSKRGSNPFAYSHIGPMYLPIGAQNPSKKGSKSGQK